MQNDCLSAKCILYIDVTLRADNPLLAGNDVGESRIPVVGRGNSNMSVVLSLK